MKLIACKNIDTKLCTWLKNTVKNVQSDASEFYIPLQTEKELSKLMSRAMKEGLEGLVLKDVNVMQ